MELEARLRAFAALARRGSFSGAAEELYVSQPAISKHMAALEAEVGRPLVSRGRSGSPLTPAGELLADYVLRAEALLANARRALATGAEAESGTLSIAASGIPGTYLLPDLLLRFLQRYPSIELDFEVSTSAEALGLVRAHRAELGVVGGFEAPAELASETLLDDEVVLAGPAALRGRRFRPQDLEAFTWISRSEGSATRAAVETARWELGLHAVRTLELPSWEAVKRAVAKGAGIAAISRLALDVELEAGTLAVLDVPRWRLNRTIAIVRARDVPLTPPAERFLQLLRDAFAADDEAPVSRLPMPSTRLIGREREVADVNAAIEAGERVVTLTGVGGSGKTRVAVEVARTLESQFPDGAFFVDLAPLREPALVVPTISRALGEPDPGRLEDHLRGRSLLLVLDNLEHLLDAAPQIAQLIRSAPAVRVLATSRSPLGLAGERSYSIEPLEPAAAAALFAERAGIESDETVTEICERLDRLPLALELAAARARSLSLDVLAKRLTARLSLGGGPRDAPERQRTLRATIEWSYNLLGTRERRLFAQLGVFVGGWSIDAAESVCGADLDTLATLVEVSLIGRTGERFAMLETVRELAVERLNASGEVNDIRRRHAEHFLAFAEGGRQLARGPREKEWLERVELDLDNLRAALGWALERRDATLGLTLADALEPLWIRGARDREGLAWLERMLKLDGEVGNGVRAGALAVAARVGLRLGERERAASWNRESLELARRAGDELRIAWALHGLGHDAWTSGDLVTARARFEESLHLFERLEQYGPAGGRLTFLGVMATDEGDLAEARSLYERAAASFGKAGDVSGVAASLLGLGELALRDGDAADALRRYREAFPLVDRMRSTQDVVYCLTGIACVLAKAGKRSEAATLWGAADTIDAQGDVRELRDEDRRFYEGRLGPLDGRAVESGRALATDEALSLAGELLAEVGSTFPARRRSRLARTSGHSSSSTE